MPTVAVLPTQPACTPCTSQGQLDCTIGTCNVLTMKATKPFDDELGFSGPSRQQIVLQQFKDANVCIFALQETRLRQCSKNLLEYILFRGDATQEHHGIMIAISTTIPYGHYEDDNGKRHDLLFTTKDVSVVCATSRHLILRLQTPWMHCVMIAGHAPHSGHSAEDIDHWWTSLAAAIPAKLASWPIVLLVDANARVGGDTCEAIGAHGPEHGGDKALPFTSFVREHGLWLPSTFPCHFGPTGTWRHPSGSWHRNDYIGLSTFWPITNCKSWVSDDIDV